jgi:hypothetical protein
MKIFLYQRILLLTRLLQKSSEAEEEFCGFVLEDIMYHDQ